MQVAPFDNLEHDLSFVLVCFSKLSKLDQSRGGRPHLRRLDHHERAEKGKEAPKPRLLILGVETEFERLLTLVLRQSAQQIVNCMVTQSGHVSWSIFN